MACDLGLRTKVRFQVQLQAARLLFPCNLPTLERNATVTGSNDPGVIESNGALKQSLLLVATRTTMPCV